MLVVMISSLCLSDPHVKAGLLEAAGAEEGGRFSVSPVNGGDRPGNLLMQQESSDMGRSDFH